MKQKLAYIASFLALGFCVMHEANAQPVRTAGSSKQTAQWLKYLSDPEKYKGMRVKWKVQLWTLDRDGATVAHFEYENECELYNKYGVVASLAFSELRANDSEDVVIEGILDGITNSGAVIVYCDRIDGKTSNLKPQDPYPTTMKSSLPTRKAKKRLRSDRAATESYTYVDVLGPAVMDRLASHFMDLTQAMEATFQMNMTLGTSFDAMRLYAMAAGGNNDGLKRYFQQQFSSRGSFNDMQLYAMRQDLGLSDDELKAFQRK